jgi:hypothetical protein
MAVAPRCLKFILFRVILWAVPHPALYRSMFPPGMNDFRNEAPMSAQGILDQRLHNQLLSRTAFRRPHEVVGWLGAVQSQDFAAAKWALGLRLPDSTDAQVEHAFNEGLLLRTHILRPTWHFVLPSDIHWMLKLTAPRVHARAALYYRKLELDAPVFKHSEAAMRRALRGGKFLTRTELSAVLEKAGITGVQLRFTYLMMHAELEGVVCSGPRRGKQFTYALLSERAPSARRLDRDASLAELARMYFRSHGPATANDFSWWSGLTLADVKRGLEMVSSEFICENHEGRSYWLSESRLSASQASRAAYLLPNFDEYVVGYTDRHLFFDSSYDEGQIPRNSMLSHHTLALKGRLLGTWRRTLNRDSVTVEVDPFDSFTPSQRAAIRAGALRYAQFLGMQLELK